MTSAMSTSEAEVLFRWPLPEQWIPHLVAFKNDYGCMYAIFQVNERRVKLTWLERYQVFAGQVLRKHPRTRRWRSLPWNHYEPEDLARLYQTWSRHDP